MRAVLEPDTSIMDPIIDAVGNGIDSIGGVTEISGPQIERALMAMLVQVAIQRGIIPEQFDLWADNMATELKKACRGIWELQP